MNKTKLIPFDLERWKAGDFKRVVTKEGKEVSDLTYFGSGTKETYPLVGVLENYVESWAINGGFSTIDRSSPLNLMLEVEDKTLEGWVRVYKGRFGNSVYKSYEEARDTIDPTFVTIIKIEYPNDNN
jgi:hypothetical protein